MEADSRSCRVLSTSNLAGFHSRAAAEKVLGLVWRPIGSKFQVVAILAEAGNLGGGSQKG
jgi:hypothetical protein